MNVPVPASVAALSETVQETYQACVTLYLQDVAKRTLVLTDQGYDPELALAANVTVDILLALG